MQFSIESYNEEYKKRFLKFYDEFKWLYHELYSGRTDMFESLCDEMFRWYKARSVKLKGMDRERESHPDWYRGNQMLGMMMYVDAFAGNLKGVKGKLDYIEECNVNYLHLMPLLDSPEGRSDGGYAVADFRKVKPELGTMEDLESLAEE